MPYLTTHQAAEILGVHDSSIKRWCSEDALECSYTSGGHRRIAVQAITAFARSHQLACRLLDLHPFEEKVWRGIKQAQRQHFTTLNDLVYEWVTTASLHLINERRLVVALLQFLVENGHQRHILYDHLLTPVLRRVGEQWKQGRLNIADEHRITQVIIDAIYTFNKHQYWSMINTIAHDASRTAVVGCIQGNEHEIGALMVRHILEENGWFVVYLGANVPHVDFSYQQEKYQAGLMCVSFNGTSHDFEAHKLLDALVARYNPTCPYQLAMGGSEVDWQLFESETEWPFQGIHVFHEITAFSEWI